MAASLSTSAKYKTPGHPQKRAAQRQRDEPEKEILAEMEKQTLLSLIKATSRVRNTQDLITLFSKKIKDQGQHYQSARLVFLEDKTRPDLAFITGNINTLLKSHPEAHLSAVCLLQITKPLRTYLSALTGPITIDPAVPSQSAGDPVYAALKDLIQDDTAEGQDNARQQLPYLIMPLMDNDQLMGLLQIQISPLPNHHFPDSFLTLIRQIAPLLTGALLNIIDQEAILRKTREESFLLEFSSGIAAVRSKEDLSGVIYSALKKLGRIRAYFIRVIAEEDGRLIPLMHDTAAFYTTAPRFRALLETRISAKEGISRRVLTAGQPVTVDFAKEIRNGSQDPYVIFWKQVASGNPAFAKMTGAALKVGQQNIGILWVITDNIDTRILEGISAQISIAISNIKANEALLRKKQEKTALLSLSQDMAALRNRNDLFQKCYTKITSILGIEEFGMLLMDDNKQTYRIIIDEAATFARLHPGHEKVLEQVFQTKDPVFTRISQSEQPVYFDVDSLHLLPEMPAYVRFWKDIGLRRVAGIPLKVGGVIIGIAVFHVDPVSYKTPAYSALLQAVSHQLAVAISNIHANEQILQYKQMLELENTQLKEEINSLYNFSEIIGKGAKMQEVYRLIRLVASTSSTVLILGETGTGKELIARAIHRASPRKDKLMIKVNCAALPASLIESELFGHEKGAFTGAIERRIGKFELANDGTIFLDEIGEMPLETQVRLLRVIQEREFERIGGSKPVKVDVRIIAATNRKLDIEVNEGRFRPDLYYRLNVFPVHLPPLRERTEDIEALTQYFVQKYSKRTGHQIRHIAAGVYKQLRSYSWPGNVRELEHLIERSILLMEGSTLNQVQLPVLSTHPAGNGTGRDTMALKDLEAVHIIEVLKNCRGKISGIDGAASQLGLPATTLHSKIKKLGIQKSDYLP